MFSIVIPTLNNLDYLKLCLQSLENNSSLKNEIIIHVNEGMDGTFDFIKKNKLKYTFSKKNLGMCSAVNLAAKKSTLDYILYAHDDMYFLPHWDTILKKEILKLENEYFFLSGTLIGQKEQINFDCGDNYENFNEEKLLTNYKNYNYYDYQGTHYAPHVIHKKLWNRVNGFSEEFNPGFGSDPDLNMKLWKLGVRYFKGINDFKVYHFGSISMRKKKNLKINNGHRIFLKKWGFSIKFFKKYFLNTGCVFRGPLRNPDKTASYLINLLSCKLQLIFSYFQR